MGLHAAPATRDEDTYTGLGVHAAARIASLAGAGEIVASVETANEVPNLNLSDRRTVSLRNIAEPVEVVSIDWRSAGAD
jgi:class 3 adenylate cyclase